MTNYAVACEDLSISFGATKALKSVTTGFERGKITALLGMNGSGKSTLIKSPRGNIPARSRLPDHDRRLPGCGAPDTTAITCTGDAVPPPGGRIGGGPDRIG